MLFSESLFSANVSAERKYWGFAVFRMALPRVDVGRLPMLFTKNFMRCWINHLSQKDRYLHKVAIQVVGGSLILCESTSKLLPRLQRCRIMFGETLPLVSHWSFN